MGKESPRRLLDSTYVLHGVFRIEQHRIWYVVIEDTIASQSAHEFDARVVNRAVAGTVN
jgi:hypothetical protein